MLHEVFDITVDGQRVGVSADCKAKLYSYVHSESGEIPISPRPALLICPGGAYCFTSDREAEPVALRFFAEGFNCFVLRYSTVQEQPQARFPVQLLQLCQAVSLVRKNAVQWNVDPGQVAVCGFSAGGHLAASLGVFWNSKTVQDYFAVSDCEVYRPDALLLCYPVVTAGDFAHRYSFECLLGQQPSQRQLDTVSLEKHVGPHTPRTFLWHTYDDGAVPVENSFLFAQALRKYHVSLEMHIYPRGDHGLSLANPQTSGDERQNIPWCAHWVEDAVRWLKQKE